MFTKKHILYTQSKQLPTFEEPSLIAKFTNDEYEGYIPSYIKDEVIVTPKNLQETNTPTTPETNIPPKSNPTPKYKSNFKSKSDFISQLTPVYESILISKNIDPTFAKALVQQSGLESNWGKSQSGKFNFGGIKGKGTVRRTREVIDGKDIHINDSFRDFESLEDYAKYHISLLSNKRYQAFSGTINDFAERVSKGGYATDPNYKKILNDLITKGQKGFKYITPKSNNLPGFSQSVKIKPKFNNTIIDWSKAKSDSVLKSKIRNFDTMERLDRDLGDLPKPARLATIAKVIQESAGDVFAKNKDTSAYGLGQWVEDRYENSGIDINETDYEKAYMSQLHHLKSTLFNTKDRKSWGYYEKSGLSTGYDINQSFLTTDDPNKALENLVHGYTRPFNDTDKDTKNDTDVLYPSYQISLDSLLKYKNNNKPLEKKILPWHK